MPKVNATRKHTTAPKSSVNGGVKIVDHVKDMKKQYKKIGSAAKAKAMKSYMRGQFHYFGIQAPERRAVDKDVTVFYNKSKLTS